MATLDQHGFTDDDSANLSIAGTTTTTGNVFHHGNVFYPGQAAYLAQPIWYVSWAAGNDGNSGADAQHPVKTVTGGIIPRWGTTDPVLMQNTVLYVLDSQPLGAEHIVLRPTMLSGTYFGIVGTPTLVTSSQLSGVTPKNRSTATLLSGSGFAGTQGQLVVNPARNSRCFVYTVHGLTASLTQPISSSFIDNTLTNYASSMPAEEDTWAAGDVVQVYTLPMFNLEVFQVNGGETSPNLKGGAAWVQQIHIPDQTGTPGNSLFGIASVDNIPWFVDCVIDPYFICGTTSPEGISSRIFVNCALSSGGQLNAGTVWAGYSLQYGIDIGDYGAIDGDHIAQLGGAGKGTTSLFIGAIYIEATAGLYNYGALVFTNAWGLNPMIWGPGSLVLSYGSTVALAIGTFTSALLQKGGTSIDGAGLMTTYATGSWHDGVSLTPANLDLYDGGMNPRTGARFFKTSG